MDFSDYAEGLALFSAAAGGVCAGTAIVLRRQLPGLRGAPLVLAAATIFTTWLIAAHLLPGVLGALERWTPALTALLSAVLAWRLVPRSPRDVAVPPQPPHPSGAFSTLLGALGTGVVGAYLVAYVANQSGVPVYGIDALTFHQPDVARWIQNGTFWQVDQFVPDLAHGNYPQNGNVVQLAAALPWHTPAFVRWAAAPYVVLAGVSIYAAALELRAPRATAALFAAAFVMVPVVLRPGVESGVDSIMLAMFGTGVLFLLRHVRAGRRSDLVLAGLALGLSFGTKWYGVSCVAALLVVWAAGRLVARQPWRRVGGDLVVASGLVAAAGGFWLLRNWVESGNPLMPVKVAPAGITILDAPPDPILEAGGFTLLDYATDFHVWDAYILPAFRVSFELPGLALALGFVAGLGVMAIGRGRGIGPRVPALALAALVLALVYAITPYSALGPEGRPVQVDANTRYGIPALLVAGIVAAWAGGPLGRLRPLLELAALASILQGVARAPDVPRAELVTAGLALAALAGAWLWQRGRELPYRRPVVALAVVAAALVLAAAGHRAERHYERHFYSGFEPAVDAVLARSPSGGRIGVAGLWSNDGLSPVLPSFGVRLGNRVEYVGPWVRGVLRRYTSEEAYSRALARGNYDLLMVGRGFEPTGATTDEERWTQAAGWRPLARSRRLTLWAPPESGRRGTTVVAER